MKRLCLLLAFIMLFTSGCFTKDPVKSGNFKLYFAAKGNTGLGIENREIKFEDVKSKYVNTLKELLKGPSDSSKFETSINKDTKILDARVENENLTVDFSKEFNVFSGSLQVAAVVSSVVDTMLQFSELKKVRILVEGQELIAPSGEPYGFMEFIDFNTGDMSEKEITLYFADSQAMYMVPEKRTVFLKKDIKDDELYKIALEELIKGPSSENLYRTIPEEVKVEYVKLEGDLLKVDFSEEMHTKHWGGAAGESMTINSIADTMTEFEAIKGVMPTVDGGPLSIEHMVVEEPLTRNESIIYRQ
ncbi:MAG TPA: GerMN domain-containing protein [Clostridia bacterium]|nr:GerMN domain-containing protein [Clostridia bacterium]